MRAGFRVLATVAVLGGASLTSASVAGAATPADIGSFSNPFTEPTVSNANGYPRVTTTSKCIERPKVKPPSGSTGPGVTHGFIDCKPAAGGLVELPNGRNLYWDNLGGTENVETSILAEFGVVGLNDQTRVLNPLTKTWKEPTPVDAGAVSKAPIEPVTLNDLLRTSDPSNDGSLFCADSNFLPSGKLIALGGTKYTNDPGVDGTKFGATDLYGIENARIYDPKTNRWTQTGSMHYPRWYPTTTTLGDGRQFVASGLRKLEKSVNLSGGPVDPSLPAPGFGLQEGQNERWTETYDPRSGKFTRNAASARRSLPLFPRMHLLPNGHVLYNAGGQSFNPLGQAYDMALWNLESAYNPKTQSWHDLGLPGVGVTPVPGFRGSTFSVMMPLKPDSKGRYDGATFLTGGGVSGFVAIPSPGGYLALRDSYMTHIATTSGSEKMTNSDAGDMASSSTPVTGRWYGSGTLLPTGEVLATSGADRDEVVLPGLESPVLTAEIFDPKTKQWHKVARQHNPRTYHNTANLMPDGRVLIGGHATISNSYLRNITLPGGLTAPNGRDPSFEIYSPPYMYCAGQQAKIESVRGSKDSLTIQTDVPASSIESVVLVRNPSVTHVTDADQRNVELKVLSRSGKTITVRQAPNGNVAPPGPYMLFLNRRVGSCLKPSHATQVFSTSGGKIRPTSGCLARRSPIGPRNIGRVRLGLSRKRLLASPRLALVGTLARSAKRYRYCVKSSKGRVIAVFGKGGKTELVTSTAKGHGNRGVRPGVRSSRIRKRFRHAVRLTARVWRAGPHSRRLIGVRKGKVRFVAVASKRILKPSGRRALRRYVKRAGL